MGVVGVAMFAMAVLSFYWQRYADMPLLEFALQVMVFAYAGLLGVYFTAIFTTRGTTGSVIAALLVGFVTVLLLQPIVIDALGLSAELKRLSFPYQLCIGTALATLACVFPRGAGARVPISSAALAR
jgi:Na+/proline symporter